MSNTIDIELTLGALVTSYPSLARELERRKLDYCCGGAVTLGQACREAASTASPSSTPTPTCTSHKENNVLFPRVVLLEDRRLS